MASTDSAVAPRMDFAGMLLLADYVQKHEINKRSSTSFTPTYSEPEITAPPVMEMLKAPKKIETYEDFLPLFKYKYEEASAIVGMNKITFCKLWRKLSKQKFGVAQRWPQRQVNARKPLRKRKGRQNLRTNIAARLARGDTTLVAHIPGMPPKFYPCPPGMPLAMEPGHSHSYSHAHAPLPMPYFPSQRVGGSWSGPSGHPASMTSGLPQQHSRPYPSPNHHYHSRPSLPAFSAPRPQVAPMASSPLQPSLAPGSGYQMTTHLPQLPQISQLLPTVASQLQLPSPNSSSTPHMHFAPSLMVPRPIRLTPIRSLTEYSVKPEPEA